MSFGFKHGLPLDVDNVFDCRFLPNPHWIEELRPLDGRDAPVRDYVLGRPETQAFLDELRRLFELTLPAYEHEGKSYLSIAIGCTGGRHRSVAIAEALADSARGARAPPAGAAPGRGPCVDPTRAGRRSPRSAAGTVSR